MGYAKVIKPGNKVKLKSIDPSDHDGLNEEEASKIRIELGEKMADLQDLMVEAGQNSLLIVFQGLDTSGKDGSIRSILHYANVQSTKVIPFKAPTSKELAHDFLWRCHPETPGKGEIAIFNRSHYEDVVVVRVHDLVPKDVWKARYEHINHFEKLLTDSNTIILKFFLHISKDEQEQRLLEREKHASKSYKLNVGDWKERELWDDYMQAYEDALEECSTKKAMWQVIPANHKWFRDIAIFEAIIDALKPYKDEWEDSLKERGTEQKKALAAFRKEEAKKGAGGKPAGS